MGDLTQIEDRLKFGTIIRIEPVPGSSRIACPSPQAGVRGSEFPYPHSDFLSPVLRVLADQGEHTVEEIRARVAAELEISHEHLSLWLESIQQTVFKNRVALAFRQLVVHKAIERMSHKPSYRITQYGLDVFRVHPTDAQIRDL